MRARRPLSLLVALALGAGSDVPEAAAAGTASGQADGSSPFVPPAPFEVTSGVIPATPASTG